MIIISGLPASGKSTLAKKIGGRVLEYDSIAEKFGSYEELNEEKEFANQYFKLMAETGKYSVLVDVFHSRSSRKEIVSALKEKPDLIFVSCPVEECVRRNSFRLGSMVSNDEIRGLSCMFEPISIEEGFNSVWIYNSTSGRLYREA